ncbi:MAG TPA: (Fe-S)-binding protein [Novimethylophilus sp.]|jgi:glycolate oxidase iron-sulfur subunit|uniref:(Fe-S)-binding protein n=1 Tax=Novimethylophilus sp. TaxID=2137426 RepID=UPI002F423396
MNHASPIQSLLVTETGRCVACGLCLPHCPTYRKTQSEADSPRGRILLTQAVAQGTLPMSERYIEHMNLCLTCRACENACPNHVNYGTIADEARALIHQKHGSPLPLATRIIVNPALSRLAGGLLRLANSLGLRKIFKSLPAASRQYRWKTRYTATSAQNEVCLFLGCVSNALDAETLAASVFVLNRLGYTVHIPPAQTCCGGLHRQAGDSDGAMALETRNSAAFAAFAAMPVLTVASGCGARLIEFMPDRVQDINVFLAQASGWEKVTIAPLRAKIAVQEPCTLRNVLKAKGVQQTLLQHIPQAEIVALPGNAQCCGGAGSYMLTQPHMANGLRDDKISACGEVAPDYLVTANIGCALHLARGLNEADMPVQISHPVMLLARQMGFTGGLE